MVAGMRGKAFAIFLVLGGGGTDLLNDASMLSILSPSHLRPAAAWQVRLR